jgi:hypothetical protein
MRAVFFDKWGFFKDEQEKERANRASSVLNHLEHEEIIRVPDRHLDENHLRNLEVFHGLY